MRKPFVAGNWKMHGSKAMATELLTDLNANIAGVGNVDVAVCPPSLYIDYTVSLLKASASVIEVGAQNLSEVADQGAFTGEISAMMIHEVGCKYVIIGHSERRTYFGETDEIIANKTAVALEKGLTPILCVGETLEEREKNVTESVVKTQVDAVLNKVGVQAFNKIVIAYEPVWAIGTGKTASPEQAQAVHKFIRGIIASLDAQVAENLIIQYGGSVKPDNAKILFSQPDIDGGLIGGASLNASDFLAICEAAGEACLK